MREKKIVIVALGRERRTREGGGEKEGWHLEGGEGRNGGRKEGICVIWVKAGGEKKRKKEKGEGDVGPCHYQILRNTSRQSKQIIRSDRKWPFNADMNEASLWIDADEIIWHIKRLITRDWRTQEIPTAAQPRCREERTKLSVTVISRDGSTTSSRRRRRRYLSCLQCSRKFSTNMKNSISNSAKSREFKVEFKSITTCYCLFFFALVKRRDALRRN